MIQNRTINIENAFKKMSNYSYCLEKLIGLIGFEKTNNGEKLTLPDQVEIDSLIMVKNELIKIKDGVSLGDNNDDVKSFWSCGHCTYDNPIDSKFKICKMCNLPADVCMFCILSQTCYLSIYDRETTILNDYVKTI